jgi:hypothetical protein
MSPWKHLEQYCFDRTEFNVMQGMSLDMMKYRFICVGQSIYVGAGICVTCDYVKLCSSLAGES